MSVELISRNVIRLTADGVLDENDADQILSRDDPWFSEPFSVGSVLDKDEYALIMSFDADIKRGLIDDSTAAQLRLPAGTRFVPTSAGGYLAVTPGAARKISDFVSNERPDDTKTAVEYTLSGGAAGAGVGFWVGGPIGAAVGGGIGLAAGYIVSLFDD